MSSRPAILLFAILLVLGICRITLSYSGAAQGFDEPAHVACGIEWLDRGTYTLDPLHPPLSRVLIGIPLYFAGTRLPEVPSRGSNPAPFWTVGNQILNRGGTLLGQSGTCPLRSVAFFYSGQSGRVFLGATRLWRPSSRHCSGFLYLDAGRVGVFFSGIHRFARSCYSANCII